MVEVLQRLREELAGLPEACDCDQSSDEDLRTAALELALAAGHADIPDEVVEALDVFLEPEPVPEELTRKLLDRIRGGK